MLEVAKTANYIVTAADNGTLFTTVGAGAAVTFTLPALATGLVFEFLCGAGQNMIIAAAGSDKIILQNNVVGVSVTYSTSSQKIGARCRLRANAAGTKWLFENLNQGNTVTAA